MIRVNPRSDWREFIEAEAPKLGLRYSPPSTLEHETIAVPERTEAKCAAPTEGRA